MVKLGVDPKHPLGAMLGQPGAPRSEEEFTALLKEWKGHFTRLKKALDGREELSASADDLYFHVKNLAAAMPHADLRGEVFRLAEALAGTESFISQEADRIAIFLRLRDCVVSARMGESSIRKLLELSSQVDPFELNNSSVLIMTLEHCAKAVFLTKKFAYEDAYVSVWQRVALIATICSMR